MHRSTTKRDRADRGFTLTELAVVLVVVSVLVGVAIPTFLRAREGSDDRAAQARASTGLKAHKTQLADYEPYVSVGDAIGRLLSIEPTVDFEAYDPSAQVKGIVYVRLSSGNAIELVSKSQSGQCFWTRDVNGDTTYAMVPCGDEPADADFGPRW